MRNYSYKLRTRAMKTIETLLTDTTRTSIRVFAPLPVCVLTMQPYPAVCQFTLSEVTLDSPVLGQWVLPLKDGKLLPNLKPTRICGKLTERYSDLQYNAVIPADYTLVEMDNGIAWYWNQENAHILLYLGGPSLQRWRVVSHVYAAPHAAFLGAILLTTEEREHLSTLAEIHTAIKRHVGEKIVAEL